MTDAHRDFLDFTHKSYGFTLEQLADLRSEIDQALEHDRSYDGLDFCDANAGGVQVRLFHKDIQGYCYQSHTLAYDFSNRREVAEEAIMCWKAATEEDLQRFKSFLEDGEVWGWD